MTAFYDVKETTSSQNPSIGELHEIEATNNKYWKHQK